MVEVAEEPSSKANEPPVEAKLKLAAALAVWMAPTHTANARISIRHTTYLDGLATLPTAFPGSQNIIRLLEDRKMVKGPVLFVCVENVGQSQMGGLSPEILGSMHGIQGVSLVVAIECSI